MCLSPTACQIPRGRWAARGGTGLDQAGQSAKAGRALNTKAPLSSCCYSNCWQGLVSAVTQVSHSQGVVLHGERQPGSHSHAQCTASVSAHPSRQVGGFPILFSHLGGDFKARLLSGIRPGWLLMIQKTSKNTHLQRATLCYP